MSQFLTDPAPYPTRTVKVPERGVEVQLTPEELELQRRLFSSVETFPDRFKSWGVEYAAVNGLPLPVSQVVGLRGFAPSQSQVLAEETTASTSYTALSTAGPSVTGLADGDYLLLFGCIFNSAAGGDGHMSPSVNGSTPSDDDAAFAWASVAGRYNIVRGVTKTLENGNNNSVVMQYKVSSGTNGFRYRWLIVLRGQ